MTTDARSTDVFEAVPGTKEPPRAPLGLLEAAAARGRRWRVKYPASARSVVRAVQA